MPATLVASSYLNIDSCCLQVITYSTIISCWWVGVYVCMLHKYFICVCVCMYTVMSVGPIGYWFD